MNLSDIELSISPLLQHFHNAQKRLVTSNITIINQLNAHIQANKGKQLRPLLTLISACCCGLPLNAEPTHPIFNTAAAIEMLHTSTLIHDDVIDNSNLRRNSPTINNLWNNKTAVLIGDFYLAQVMKTINGIDNHLLTSAINDCVIEMCEGELLQQQYSGVYNTDIDLYLTIIKKKTATLLSTCCLAGAILTNDDTSLHQDAAKFGSELGIAFQMRDDIIDFLPSDITGKPQGNDIREHKCTLPLILALNDETTCNSIFHLLSKNNPDDNDVELIIKSVSNGGFLDKATNTMHQRLDNATQCLHRFPKSPYRQLLSDIISILKQPII